MSENARGLSFLVVIVLVLFLLAGLIGVWVSWQHTRIVAGSAAHRTGPAMTPQQQAYCASLEFSDLRMSAAENFLGATVTYLDGRVANKGAKTLRQMEVELSFVDVLNQVVLRERAYPVTHQSAPLEPGEVRTFRVNFEHLPVDWNQAPPAIKPVYVEF